MDEQFYTMQNLDFLVHFVWIIPVITALYFLAASARKKALEKFASTPLLPSINDSTSSESRVWKGIFIVLAVSLLIIAIARPAWNPKPVIRKMKGREVVFLLDVSRSMLAQDLRPSRLERSKLAINDCLSKIEGDRVALIAFAGNAKILCPLTTDYSFFKMALDDATPQSVERGGTMLGDAIRKATADILNENNDVKKDIIIITDGGGTGDDSFAFEAAKEAGEKDIRIIAIGIGDEKTGKRIPIIDREGKKHFLKYKGKEVWDKLNANLLRKVSIKATPGGKYVPVETGAFDLGEIYKTIMDQSEKSEVGEKSIRRYEEKYQIFMAIAFLLLCLEPLLGTRKKNGGR